MPFVNNYSKMMGLTAFRINCLVYIGGRGGICFLSCGISGQIKNGLIAVNFTCGLSTWRLMMGTQSVWYNTSLQMEGISHLKETVSMLPPMYYFLSLF